MKTTVQWDTVPPVHLHQPRSPFPPQSGERENRKVGASMSGVSGTGSVAQTRRRTPLSPPRDCSSPAHGLLCARIWEGSTLTRPGSSSQRARSALNFMLYVRGLRPGLSGPQRRLRHSGCTTAAGEMLACGFSQPWPSRICLWSAWAGWLGLAHCEAGGPGEGPKGRKPTMDSARAGKGWRAAGSTGPALAQGEELMEIFSAAHRHLLKGRK